MESRKKMLHNFYQDDKINEISLKIIQLFAEKIICDFYFFLECDVATYVLLACQNK